MSQEQDEGRYRSESLQMTTDLGQTARTSRLGRPHKEEHKHHGEVIRDLIIGFSDGLTVPFALTAGLSS